MPVYKLKIRYPWLKTEQLGEFQIFDTNEHISQAALDETNIKLWPPKTLSVAMYGEGQTRGNTSIIMREMTTNQACCNIIVNESKADYRYVYYWLKNSYLQLRILASGVRKNLNSDDIKSFPISYPSVPLQTRISDVLFCLDEKIALNKRINAELEAMAKTIYDYWFVQFDFPDENGKPYRTSGGKMEWDEQLKRKIPNGWGAATLNEYIIDEKGGDWGKEEKSGNYTEEVTCIRGADFPAINGAQDIKAPLRYILKKNTFKFLSNGDIIIEISGGSPTQSTGRICYINDEILTRFSTNIITSNFCKAFSLKSIEWQYWFYVTWTKLYEAGVFFKYEGKTTGIKNLLFDIACSDYYIASPPDRILKKYNSCIEPIFRKIQKNITENLELTRLRDWLLPMLMNGQATVE